MTSVQTKKGGTGASEEDRKNILRQMKVRTKLKTDKSWIQHQSSEDEHDGITSPKSPQLKSLEGKKFSWSPSPDSKPDRKSGFFTDKDNLTSSYISTVQSSNKEPSYSSAENNTPPSVTSTPSPPPSTTASRPATSYIIRGQTLNAVSQVKSPPSYNGYQKSTVQGRTNSLSRIQTATGFKMSTEQYKKLAPYNVRNKSVDLSDDEETSFTPQEQAKRTEQASSVLRNTTSKERSYVISAAKRNSGVGTQESATPVLAKRVEIQEDISPERKSQSLPKSLVTYLYEDVNRFENSWKETQSKQTPSQTSPPGVTERSSSPRLSSFTVNTNIDSRSSTTKPEVGKIPVAIEESEKNSKAPTEKESSTTTNIHITKSERVEVTENKGETLPKSLASYLYEDASRFENSWKANQANPPSMLQTTPPGVSDRPESPKLISRNTEKRTPPIKPEPAKITVLRGDSDKIAPKVTEERSSARTVTTTVKSENVDIPKLTSYQDSTETKSSSMQTGPGKITVVQKESYDSNRGSPKITTQGSSTSTTTTRTTVETRVESNKESSDIPKLTSCSLSKTLTENPAPIYQSGPGKISIIREHSVPDGTKAEITTHTRETRNESTPPKPVPRMETKSKDSMSDKQDNLISWDDIDSNTDNRLSKEKPAAAPKPIPRTINKESEKPTSDAPLIVISPDLDNRRITESQNGNVRILIETLSEQPSTPEPPKTDISSSPRKTQPSTSAAIHTANETRYRVSETLDGPELSPRNKQLISDPEHGNVSIIIETLSEQPSTPEPPKRERSSSPRRTQPSTTAAIHTANETRYRVSEALDDPELSPRSKQITSDPQNSNVRITIETLSERPSTAETPKTEKSSSPRPSPRSREVTTTSTVTETIYQVPESVEDRMLQASPARSSPRSRESTTTSTVTETRYRVPEFLEGTELNHGRSSPSSRETTTNSTFTETRYRVPEILEDTKFEVSPARSNSRTTVTTRHSTDPMYTESHDTRSTRTTSTSREKYTTTSVENRYDHGSSWESSQYDPQSSSNKGVLFVKEYVNTSENLKSPTTAGNTPNFSGDSDMLSYSTNSSYLYNSAPRKSDEGPCTYCGREIKDCAKIMLEHLNIYCHEYCFKCGICNKPMGDLIDNLFIHRDVVHCESCYEKLF